MLESLITSKTRLKLLLKFFSNPQTKSYLRSLAEEFGESTNAVRVELNRLSEAEFLSSKPSGNTIVYTANQSHPLFPEISKIVSKYMGIDSLIEQIISKIGDLHYAVIIGDYAKGRDSGVIELVLVGRIDQVYLEGLVKKAEQIIQRKVSTHILTEHELAERQIELCLDQGIVLYDKV